MKKIIVIFCLMFMSWSSLVNATTWACHDTCVQIGTYKGQVERIARACGWRPEFQYTIDQIAQLISECNVNCAGDVYELNQCLNFATATERAVQMAASCSGPGNN